MKKTIAAVTAGVLLVATQAFATTQVDARVGDRIGARADASSEFAGIGAPVIFIAAAIGAFALVGSIHDEGASD